MYRSKTQQYVSVLVKRAADSIARIAEKYKKDITSGDDIEWGWNSPTSSFAKNNKEIGDTDVDM